MNRLTIGELRDECDDRGIAFPTNARKSHKIAANKAAKFSKVSQKLIERVRHASPSVELSGVASD